jgi:hypothetical protein
MKNNIGSNFITKSNTETPSKINLDSHYEEHNNFIKDTPNQDKKSNDMKSNSADNEHINDKNNDETKNIDLKKHLIESKEEMLNNGHNQPKKESIATEESIKLINKMKNLQKIAASKVTNTSSRLTFEMIENKIKEDHYKQKILDKELKNLSCIRNEELGLIDEKASHEYFLKFKIEEFVGVLIYVWSLFCSILYYESHLQLNTTKSNLKNIYKAPLIMNTIFTVFSCKN